MRNHTSPQRPYDCLSHACHTALLPLIVWTFLSSCQCQVVSSFKIMNAASIYTMNQRGIYTPGLQVHYCLILVSSQCTDARRLPMISGANDAAVAVRTRSRSSSMQLSDGSAKALHAPHKKKRRAKAVYDHDQNNCLSKLRDLSAASEQQDATFCKPRHHALTISCFAVLCRALPS